MTYRKNDVHPLLKEAKQQKVRLLASDIDWTLRDPTNPKYDFHAVQKLCLHIIQKGITILILTGRDASLRRDFIPGMIILLKKHNITIPMYVGCANGISLYKLSKNGTRTIYKHPLRVTQINEILRIIKETHFIYQLKLEDFQKRGISVFQSFLLSNWNGIIPQKYIKKAKPFNGTVFIEPSKISFVLPKSQSTSSSFITRIKRELPNILCVQNDQEFGHISLLKSEKRQIIADKSFALEYVRKKMHLRATHLVVFGGALDQIDQKILQKYPFSFTSQQEYQPVGSNSPPYKLTGELSPVGLVHEAIRYIVG